MTSTKVLRNSGSVLDGHKNGRDGTGAFAVFAEPN